MSERSKLNRARREAKQEKQARNVIRGIFWALILLAVIWVVYISMFS